MSAPLFHRACSAPLPGAASLVVSLVFGLLILVHSNQAAGSTRQSTRCAVRLGAGVSSLRPAERGRALFGRNCAHCHGEDARGDEGPSLYGLGKTDACLKQIIQQGIKGEMPKFSAKFNDTEIQALIAYLRTLKNP